jgi:polyphenol oxidase
MFDIFENYPDLFYAFSEKNDGSMKLTSNPLLSDKIFLNRGKYFKNISINPKTVVSAEIVHGNKISIVSKTDGGNIIAGADGLIAQSKNIYLSVTSADCLPIFLFDHKKEIVGMVHAGWRSLEKNILAKTIKEITELDGQPENILVGIGPSICQKHYEVGSEIAEKFAGYPEAIKNDCGKIYLNIKKIALLQLLELGVKKKNIEIIPECTFEFPGKYFSARRDQKKEVEAMVAIIGMKNI